MDNIYCNKKLHQNKTIAINSSPRFSSSTSQFKMYTCPCSKEFYSLQNSIPTASKSQNIASLR